MLKKENRITKKADYDLIFKKGKSSYDNLIGIKNLKNSLQKARIGIIVSLKTSKQATQRNKIKRTIREIFKNNLKNIEKNNDYLIIALPSSVKNSYKEIENSIIGNLKKIKKIK